MLKLTSDVEVHAFITFVHYLTALVTWYRVNIMKLKDDWVGKWI